MIRRWIAALLALMLLPCAALAEDGLTYTRGELESDVPLKETYPDNPVIPGVSPTTGLPASGEAYTPIVSVIEQTNRGYPHWGVAEADIMFQVPNQGGGNTKLMALFADHYPEAAGGVRSARATMVPVATAFGAAFAYGGIAPIQGANVNVDDLCRRNGMRAAGKTYNLLGGGGYAERVKFLIEPMNLSCFVKKIHEDLVNRGVRFEERPFLFTDEPRAAGDSAAYVEVRHYNSSCVLNVESNSSFTYSAELGGYTRTNCNGDTDIDRFTEETLVFANLIVLRVGILAGADGYLYLSGHMAGSGAAEIFQNGHYAEGAWMRETSTSRLVLLDAEGEELPLQRGRTFIILCNTNTKVGYR